MTSLTETTEIPRRLVWLDCVKVIGMYLIIVGHMDVPGREFVYGVSVPVFFWASGYLEKDVSWPILLRKCLLNLFLPTLVLVLLYKTVLLYMDGFDGLPFEFIVKNVACSFLGIFGWYGIGVGWFIYTLICLKLLYKVCGLKYLTWAIIPAAILAVIFSFNGLFFTNGLANVTVAIPFFVAGVWCRKLCVGERISKWTFLMFMTILVLYGIGVSFNGIPWMFMNDYGRSYLLFTVTGLLGIISLVWIGALATRRLPGVLVSMVTMLAEGALPVLCTHQFFVHHMRLPLSPWIFALILYLSYLPAIWLCSRWCPFIIGKYGRKTVRRVGAVA